MKGNIVITIDPFTSAANDSATFAWQTERGPRHKRALPGEPPCVDSKSFYVETFSWGKHSDAPDLESRFAQWIPPAVCEDLIEHLRDDWSRILLNCQTNVRYVSALQLLHRIEVAMDWNNRKLLIMEKDQRLEHRTL